MCSTRELHRVTTAVQLHTAGVDARINLLVPCWWMKGLSLDRPHNCFGLSLNVGCTTETAIAEDTEPALGNAQHRAG